MSRKTQLRSFSPFLFSLFLLCLIFGSSCVSHPVSQDIPPGTELLFSPVPDPWEGYNRSVELLNRNFVEHLLFPVSQAYSFIVPELARDGIHNFGVNLSYPLRLINCLLQCKPEAAWEESKRFAVNSTVGILGLRDQASRWDMPLHQEDFGQSLAYYNCPEGCYFNLPFLGPSNLRDCAGLIITIPCSLQYWLFKKHLVMGSNALFFGNEAAAAAPALNRYFNTQYDSYLLSRAVYSARRRALAIDYRMPPCESAPDQSLGYLLLTPRDPKFANLGRQRRVLLPGSKSRLPYSCWPNPDSNKTLLILPGLGGHRLSTGVLALAELLHKQGYSVLALSSSLNPDYFTHLPETAPPGFFYADRKQQALALAACAQDMQEHFKLPKQNYSVLGMSLGAINALYLSDLELEEGLPGGLQIERYLAINPPVDAIYALKTIDRFFAIPQSWPAEQRLQRSEEMMLKLVTAPSAPDTGQSSLPLSLEESQFLIALNMRMNLAETIAGTQKQNNQGFLQHDPEAFNKNAFWLELMNLSFDDYIRLSIMPYYHEKLGYDPDLLLQRSKLTALEAGLRRNTKLRVLHNRNDFLINSEQLSWYSQVFGERVLLLPEGGHLGNMYHPDYQALIVKMLQ